MIPQRQQGTEFGTTAASDDIRLMGVSARAGEYIQHIFAGRDRMQSANGGCAVLPLAPLALPRRRHQSSPAANWTRRTLAPGKALGNRHLPDGKKGSDISIKGSGFGLQVSRQDNCPRECHYSKQPCAYVATSPTTSRLPQRAIRLMASKGVILRGT